MQLIPHLEPARLDWGVCGNPASHRAGLLTSEHQGCPQFEREQSRFGLDKSKQEEGRNAIAHHRGIRDRGGFWAGLCALFDAQSLDGIDGCGAASGDHTRNASGDNQNDDSYRHDA